MFPARCPRAKGLGERSSWAPRGQARGGVAWQSASLRSRPGHRLPRSRVPHICHQQLRPVSSVPSRAGRTHVPGRRGLCVWPGSAWAPGPQKYNSSPHLERDQALVTPELGCRDPCHAHCSCWRNRPADTTGRGACCVAAGGQTPRCSQSRTTCRLLFPSPLRPAARPGGASGPPRPGAPPGALWRCLGGVRGPETEPCSVLGDAVQFPHVPCP